MQTISNASIGKKAIMAVSGLVLVLFVIGHLMGNLLVFFGPEALNGYALKLRHLGPGLWIARGFLLTALIAHVWVSIHLSRENRKARPVGYRVYRTIETDYATRTMFLSGFLVLAYIIYHLLHFTFGVTNPGVAHLTDSLGHHDVYSMVVRSFQNPLISVGYIVGMALLWSHLNHGVASAFQSLGLNTGRTIPFIGRIGKTISILLFLGYCAIPIAVLFGLIRPAGSLQ